MPLLTKAQYETMLDTIAAQAQAARDGLQAAADTPQSGSLFEQIDAVGNPDIEVFLLPNARTHDNLLRDPATLMRSHLGSIFGPILSRLQAQVQDDGTLSTRTLDGALSAVGAQVAPIIGELALASQALSGPLSPANVFSPPIASGSFDAVYGGAPGALVDRTSDARDVDTGDVPLFAANNDVLYLGYNAKPTTADEHIAFALSTVASAAVGLVIQYWNGSAWVLLSHTDADTTGNYANQGTKGFTQSGVIKFAVPPAWSRTNRAPDGSYIFGADKTQRYYLRLQRTTGVVATAPVASLLSRGIGLGLVLVKSDGTAQFIAGAGVDTSRHDAVNKLKLRALTNISADVTATINYTNRAGTANRSQAQAAWNSIDAGDVFPAAGNAFLALQTAGEGVQAITGVSVATTATAGAFVVESVMERTPVK